MQNLYELLDFWYIKMIFGALLALMAPVQVTVVTIFIMIIMDTITGVISSFKAKRFNSRTLRKCLRKILTYSTSIVTVRLIENGVLTNQDTTILTQIIGGFLIITEAISVLENLTILGLPLPTNFLNVLFKQLRIEGLEALFNKSQEERKELQDIEDILYFQVPIIKSEELRRLLEIKFDVWIGVARKISDYFEDVSVVNNADNDLIYYKMQSIITIAFEEMYTRWNKENIPKCYIEGFNSWHEQRVSEWLAGVKDSCYRITSIQNKKKDLIKKVTILLYQTIIDAQKYENQLVCSYE